MKPLASPISLLRQAFSIYLSKQNRKWFLFLGLLPTIVSFLFSFAASFVSRSVTDISLTTLLFVIVIALGSALLSLLFYIFLYRFIYSVVSNETIDVKLIVNQSWKRITKLFITNVFMVGLILIGFILLIIPGLIFFVWYYFAPLIAVIEDPKLDALKTSKNLVRGTFWPVTGRIVIFASISILPSVLLQQYSPYLSLVWQIFTPYFSLVTLLFYLDLKSSKTN